MIFVCVLNFHNFQWNKFAVVCITCYVITTIRIDIFRVRVIWNLFFPLITYLVNYLRMWIKIFDFFFWGDGFSSQFPNIKSKTSTLYSANILIQEDSKYVDPILLGTKKVHFFTAKIQSCNLCGQLFGKNSTHYFNSLRQNLTIE
jgi:hypothetical protein